MDRRIAGMLLLVVALVATLAVPNVIGRHVNGAAVAETIANPPAVGSCVSAVTQAVQAAPGAGSSMRGLVRTLPVATAVPCTGKVIGEIISVLPESPQQNTTLQEFDDANPSCRSQVETYLGTTATTDLLGVQWSKSIYVSAVTVGPDAHDAAAGRTWSACVLSAVGQKYQTPPTLRSSWTARTLPAALGLCWAQGVVQHGVPTPCTAAHRTQQLAFGFVSAPSDSSTSIVSAATPAGVATGCQILAATIMDVKDPTFGGALAVDVVRDPAGAPYLQCAVSATGGKHLVGSLIGLGSKALPLS